MKFIGQLLGQHLQRYPRMELTDIYKLLHQAAIGAGHAIRHPTQARAALHAERHCHSVALARRVRRERVYRLRQRDFQCRPLLLPGG